MDQMYKEVRFDIYCEKCKHKDLKENKSPCNECLEQGMNDNSEKPVNYESK